MGKIIQQPVKFIKDNTEHMLDNQFSDYTKFLGSAPIFVTYYNQNIIDTTLDNGFGNTYGNVTSEESSKKYNKINDLPLFKVPNIYLEMLFDDNRLSVSFES